MNRLSYPLTFALVAALVCGIALAQDPQTAKNKYANDPCGDPTFESSMWNPIDGTVVKVLNGNTLVLLYEKKRKLTVHLVAVDAPRIIEPLGLDAQRFLEDLVGGKQVVVWIGDDWLNKRRRPNQITGVVYIPAENHRDVNQALINAGLARHKDSELYTMSNYTECHFRIAENEARKARRGVWQTRQ